MLQDPTVYYGPTLAPVPGWLKSANVDGIIWPIEAANFNHQNSFQYTKYAVNPQTGAKQKTIHSRGTREVSWNLSGDLFIESQDLVNFLTPLNRGRIFPVSIQQSATATGIQSAMLESINLTGSAEGIIHLNLTGKGLTDIVVGQGWTFYGYKYPVPAWSSGNVLVKSWSLTHTTPLQANWFNDQNPLPAYYRVGDSEYNMLVTTVGELREYDTISIGVGQVAIVTGLVTSRSLQQGGKEPNTYEVQMTNVSVNQSPTTLAAVGTTGASAPAGWL